MNAWQSLSFRPLSEITGFIGGGWHTLTQMTGLLSKATSARSSCSSDLIMQMSFASATRLMSGICCVKSMEALCERVARWVD